MPRAHTAQCLKRVPLLLSHTIPPTNLSGHLCTRCVTHVQEVGSFAADPQPTTTTHGPTTCSSNLGGSVADPDYDNPTYSIFNTTTYAQSPSLTVAALLEAWPVNSYPYVVQLPSGSVYLAAGAHRSLCKCICMSQQACPFVSLVHATGLSQQHVVQQLQQCALDLRQQLTWQNSMFTFTAVTWHVKLAISVW